MPNGYVVTAESVMCDVIKIRLIKRKNERRSEKGNPQKRDGYRLIFKFVLHVNS